MRRAGAGGSGRNTWRSATCLIELDDGASITALLYLLAFAPIGTAIKPGEPVPEAGAT